MREALDALVAEMVDKGIRFDEACGEFERRFIKRVLDRAAGNRSHAAQALGMHRNTLSRKLEELQLAARPQPRASRNGRRARA
ncbi:MAG: helix-turn-helix domain-containing protein [Terriglobales bacterium]